MIECLRDADRLAPVLLATQGHSMEEDHLAEARLREDVSGVVASGDASDNATIAEVAKVSPNTANKLATNYSGPLLRRRNEHDDHLPLTQAAVYRWCGLHARYIVSWCRRHGHADVLEPQMVSAIR